MDDSRVSINTQRSNPTRNDAWLIRPRPNPRVRVRLFCFPYSGAGASLFHAWPKILPDSIEVCPVELPGRGARLAELPFTQLAPLVEAVAAGLYPYLNMPFAFFGHSMGALLSFELARYLNRRHSLKVAHLFVSGHGAPQVPSTEPPIHDLPEAEFVQKLREFNGTPDAIFDHPELRAILLPILRADFAVCETYVYESAEPLDCPLTALGGLRDPYVTQEALQKWCEQTKGPFSLHMFPGDHFYLQSDQQLLLETIARKLMQQGVLA